jgi:hypothetical protein
MTTGLRVEDRLDGATNFCAWKERMILLLQENELWDIVENTTTHPVLVPTDAPLLAAYTKKSIKAKRIILDAIKDHELCKGCSLGKYTKTIFPSSDSRAIGILDLIHYDVCGSMSSTSLTGFLYYVVFIDDFSWKSWIFFRKMKEQVFSWFQEFKALVENQKGKKTRVPRTDNGGEYTSKCWSL